MMLREKEAEEFEEGEGLRGKERGVGTESSGRISQVRAQSPHSDDFCV